MKIETILAGEDKGDIIRNIYPLYLYELAGIYQQYPNEYGIYEDEPIKTLAEQYHVQDNWFKYPEYLFPYIITVDDKPAGFIMIATKRFIPKTTDHYVYEFFLLNSYRGKGIAEIAAGQVFDRFKGRWELYTRNTNNERGQKFWRKTIDNYTKGDYLETEGMTFIDDEIKKIFRFSN